MVRIEQKKEGKNMKTMQEIISTHDEKYKYMLLDRMRADCTYFLGNGNRHVKYLWAGNVEDQIADMKMLWNSFKPCNKPEWLTMADIESLEKRMKD